MNAPAPSLPPSAGQSKYRDNVAGKRFRPWHETIIDDMLARPFDTVKERARRLGYSPSYLSIIMNSDMFKAAYTHRRELYSVMLDTALQRKTMEVADLGLSILKETMELRRTALPFKTVAETTMSVLEKLGYGQKPSGAGVTVNVQANGGAALGSPVSAEVLAGARDKLRQIESFRAAESEGPLPKAGAQGQAAAIESLPSPTSGLGVVSGGEIRREPLEE